VQFADWLRSTSGQTVGPDTFFACQVKRIHEYTRQLLNALRIVILYNRVRENPHIDMMPRTFFFAGKAAAYQLAKLVIKFITNLVGTIDGDPSMRGRLRVATSGLRKATDPWQFLPEQASRPPKTGWSI
jgi:glycogen phosphorylase